MNKSEKIIVAILGLLLVGYFWHSTSQAKKEAEEQEKVLREQAAAEAQKPAAPAQKKEAAAQKPGATVQKPAPAEPPKAAKPHAPEQVVKLVNDQKGARAEFEFSSWGATLKSATLLEFSQKPGAQGEDNPPFKLDFSDSPALALSGVPGLDADADWTVTSQTGDSVTFTAGPVVRTITLKDNYQLHVKETFTDVPEDTPTHVSLGIMSRAKAKDGSPAGDLSIDSYSIGGEKESVIHWNDADHPLKHDLASASGGCSCSKRPVQGLAPVSVNNVDSASRWIAQKNDYFVTAILNCSEAPSGFSATVARQSNVEAYVPQSVSAAAAFKSLKPEREYTLYVGPKKQAILWDLGLKDVMDFGMWRWLCYGMVWVLNLFYALIPNYGVAIILLTILVRVLFWPLTHKSTISMRKMQEIQPLLKEVQAKYKGNPQRLQQETWQLYREHKVNPLSSCLPMLIQIPVFFALFVVLRGAVELRYAPFLWIKDLSQPEALFASWFPFGGLNILPILMAATMALQSALTPSAGDKSQQRMMMVFMPIMMLFMFYNFASALSLYWTLSQVISIGQMWWIRKKYGTSSKPAAKDGVIEPDSVEMPQTRQMRRHP